jgi:hypothetical protein
MSAKALETVLPPLPETAEMPAYAQTRGPVSVTPLQAGVRR